MNRYRDLRLETLESRDVPATFGVPWPDSGRLTVSFVPDGTRVGHGEADTSRLFATLDALMPRAAWQRQVLAGIQAWAANTGLNVVVVPDSGDPLGTAGLAQGDPRFGDVRIAGLALSPGSVSESVPFAAAAGTWAGDLLFNTDLGLATEYDLKTVTMHEFGQVLGLAGNMDHPGDVMFEYYTGPKAGPSGHDIEELHQLAGPRPADRFEDVGSFREAARRAYLDALAGRDEDAAIDPDLPFAVDADLTSGDADAFCYTAGGHFTVRLLTGGRSLLSARVVVTDAGGEVVAAGTTLRVAARFGARFTVRVEATDGDFDAGAYRLVVRDDRACDGMTGLTQRLAARLNANDSRGRATDLALGASYRGRLDRHGDRDYYRLSPLTGTSLDVQLWGGGKVAILDAEGRVVGRGKGEVRLSGLTAGATYWLRVSGAKGSGEYVVAAREGVPAVGPDLVADAALTDEEQQHFHGIYWPQSGVMRLEIDVSGASPSAAVEAVLFDREGQVVWSRTLSGGSVSDAVIGLPRGPYTLRLVGATADGSALALPYQVRTTRLSDPIGPKLQDPTKPPPRFIDPLWYDRAGFKHVVAVQDPFGRPIPFKDPPPVVTLPRDW